MAPEHEKRRLIVILSIGLPVLFLVYGYFFYREQGKLDGTAWVQVPDRAVDWCVGKWDELIARYYGNGTALEPPDTAAFAPGSAGNAAKSPRMYGMEVPLEEHRNLVLESTKGGQLSIPEGEKAEEAEAVE